MKKLRFLSVISSVLLFLGVLPVSYEKAYSAGSDYNWYTVGIDKSGEVTVPEVDRDKTVTAVYIMGSEEVTTISIPVTVQKIDVSVSRCSSLTAYYVDEDNPYLCSVDGVVYSKQKDELICYPQNKADENYKVLDSAEKIGEFAFRNANNLTSVDLPNNLKTIDKYAFVETKISDFDLPESLEYIGMDAFGGNNALETIIIPENVSQIMSPFYKCDSLKTVILLRKEIDEYEESSSLTNRGNDFYSSILDSCSDIVVYVPDFAYEMYSHHAPCWEGCKELKPLSEYTGPLKNKKGDVNCDWQVDLADAILIMQALANPNKYGIDGTAEHHLTEQGRINGDMDGDGLTVDDAQAIQLKLLGLYD